MSPLARSLLALAALLAAADAQNDCVTFTIGQVTPYPKPLTPANLIYGDNDLVVNNYCTPPMHQVGESIKVCNNSPGYPPATYDPPPPPALSPVTIHCHDPTGCTAETVEYCGY